MKKKIAFGKPFFSILSSLELRLNILLIRMRFASKLLEANTLVSSRLIYVNGSLKQKNYLVRVNDIVYNKPKSLSGSTRFFTKK
jgi:ribosomal protein S4